MWILSLLHKSFVPFAQRGGRVQAERARRGCPTDECNATIIVADHIVIPAQAGASASGMPIQKGLAKSCRRASIIINW